MTKLLILVKKYPTEHEPYAMTYVHSRCIEYKKRGVAFDVLSFDNSKSYTYQGINVITQKEAASNINSYTHIVSHAPNLRQHLPFLLKYCTGKSKTLFLHGHEVLIKSHHYPKAYSFKFKNTAHRLVHNTIHKLYDSSKTKIIRYLISKTKNSSFILVSNHLKSLAQKDLKTDFPSNRTHIINNCVNEEFITKSYLASSPKIADVVTIRQLDNSTYCMDIVHKLALENPNVTFTVYGKGVFFDYNSPPSNITLIKGFFKHEQLPEILSAHRVALMPTKHDTQGVMSCEMATFGIPLITSNIAVCQEIFADMPNVALIEDYTSLDLEDLIKSLARNISPPNKTKFSPSHTIEKELNTIIDNS